jgi:ankyrin repeat protein
MFLFTAGLGAYLYLQIRHTVLVHRLFAAIQVGDLAKMERILTLRGISADEHDQGWSRQTALMTAVEQRRPEFVRSLLDHGARVDLPCQALHGNHGRTALMFSAVNGGVDSGRVTNIANLLIERGASVDARDGFGQTALVLAIEGQSHVLSRVLLEHGANPNVTSAFGKPALNMAIESGQFETARLLLAKGANPNAVDRAKKSASINSGQGSPSGALTITAPVSVLGKTTAGKTALMGAVEQTNREMVELLIRAGANVNALDRKKQSALSIATTNGHLEIIRILKSAGATD